MAARKKYPSSFSIVLPVELRRALDAIADAENDSLGVIVRRACLAEVQRAARVKAKAEAKEIYTKAAANAP